MSEQPLLDIEALRKIDAKPGDVFALALPSSSPPLSDQMMACIGEQIRSVLGDVKVLVLPPGMRLEKVPQGIRLTNTADKPLMLSLLGVSVGFDPAAPGADKTVTVKLDAPALSLNLPAHLASDPAIMDIMAQGLRAGHEAIDRLMMADVPSLKEANAAHESGDSDVAALADAAEPKADEPAVIQWREFI